MRSSSPRHPRARRPWPECSCEAGRATASRSSCPAAEKARLLRRAAPVPVLHIATFPLRASDGDFGAAATGRMGRMTSWQFSSSSATRPIRPGVKASSSDRAAGAGPGEFTPRQLQVTRAAPVRLAALLHHRGPPELSLRQSSSPAARASPPGSSGAHARADERRAPGLRRLRRSPYLALLVTVA